MISHFAFIVLILSISGLTSGVPNDRQFCERQIKQADDCTKSLFVYGDRSARGWPSDLQTYDEICNMFREKRQCVKNARNCFTPFSQQIIGLLLKGLNDQVKSFCGPKVDRLRMLSFIECGNTDLPHDHKCIESFVATLKGAINLPQDAKIPTVCCSAHRVQNCILGRMEKNPTCTTKIGNQTSLKLYREIVKGIVGDSLDLVCSNIKAGSDICLENDRLAIPVNNSPGKSILIPLITVLNSL